MIKSCPMRLSRTITIFFIVFFAISLLCGFRVFAQDGKAARGLDSERVRTSLDELIATDKYNYDPGILDDPPWLVKLKEWLKNFSNRSGFGILNGLNMGSPIVISIIVGIAVFIMFIFVLIRRMGAGRKRGFANSNADGIDGLDAFEAWGDLDSGTARKLASQGRFKEACSVLFKSALKGLGKSGWIKYRTSGGSRQYLRQLRRSEELYPLYRDLLGRFEVAYYRKDIADETDWTFMLGIYETLAKSATTYRPANIT